MSGPSEQPIFERSYPDEDCGCPVEEWLLRGIHLTLHFEPDGSMEMFADAGDWEADFPLKADTMQLARAEAFAWVHALPSEDEAGRAPEGREPNQ